MKMEVLFYLFLYTFCHFKRRFSRHKKQFKDKILIIIIVMLKKSEDTEKYISGSKVNIDNYIRKNEYRKAFGLLILFLERLDGEEKTQVIDYYSKNMQQFGVFYNTFPSK